MVVMKNSKGFTLVETVVVVFLLGLIVAVSGSLFFAILKGASKAEVVKEVKQNGDYAMNFMIRTIRNAQSIQSCEASSLTIENSDQSSTTFYCLIEDSVTKIASGSSALTNKTVTAGSPCSLSFVCQEMDPPAVTISFTLFQKGAVGQRVEETAQSNFRQTVQLRTY